MERPQRLTAAFVEKIDQPGRYSDGPGSHGLTLLVRPRKDGMSKNWAQQLRVNGKLRSFGLGSFPQVRLAEARTVATEQAAKIKEAFPPYARRVSAFERLLAEAEGRSLSVYPTFAEVAEQALAYDSGKWKGSKTADQRRGLIKTYLNPVLGDLEIDRITSEHVTEALRPIWNEKASTAKKVWLALTATFNYAIGQGWIPEGVDPLPRAKIGLGRQAVKVEHRKAVPYDRIGEVWRVLTATTAGKSGNTSRALQFIVLTGVRSSEATGARWAEINMADATWTIPASRMKGGREHRVPLAPAALDVLRRVKEAATPPIQAYELTFPNGNGHGRQINAMTALRFFHRQFEGDYSIHGLRSTFQDWAAEQTDTPAEIVEHALAHLEGSATIRAYRRTDYFEKRRSLMSAWADYVDGTVSCYYCCGP